MLMSMNQDDYYKLEYYDSIQARDVSWLWYPYIPYGKVTIVQGDPGEGKTTLMLQIAAMITTGRSIPTGETACEPQTVIFQGAEDGKEDTIKPRLIKAGADCSKVAFINADYAAGLSIGDERFRKAITDTNAKLLVIDPVQAFLKKDTDSQTPGGFRSAFAALAKNAEESGCAVVLIGHMNKGGSNGKSIYRGLGSIDIAAAARSVLVVGRDKEDPDIRIIVPVKSSLAPEGNAYAFRLDREKGFQWVGKYDISAEELLSNSSFGERKIERAKACLMLLLNKEDMISNDIFERIVSTGIGKRTIESAKQELDIVSYKKGNDWYWHLEQ